MRPENTNFLNPILSRLSRSRISCYPSDTADALDLLQRGLPQLGYQVIHLLAVLRIDIGSAGSLDTDRLVVIEIVTRQLSQPIELCEGSAQRLCRRAFGPRTMRLSGAANRRLMTAAAAPFGGLPRARRFVEASSGCIGAPDSDREHAASIIATHATRVTLNIARPFEFNEIGHAAGKK